MTTSSAPHHPTKTTTNHGSDIEIGQAANVHQADENGDENEDPKNENNAKQNTVVDAVWGEIDLSDGSSPNYRNLSWVKASVLEVKTQIGLGVLGLPAALNVLGFVPGILCILAIAIIITWSDYVVGTFKMNHPEVYTVADVGYIMFGPWGREILGFAYLLEVVATGGASFLSISVAFNAITDHATCSVVWAIIGAVVVGLLSSIQTLGRISWLGWVGLVSILSAVITLMIGLGTSGRPSLAPAGNDWQIETQAITSPTFVEAINAVCIIIFAYAGTPNFFNIVGEMKNPRDFTKSVLVGQTAITTIYLVVAAVVYHYAGQYIASPALGSAGVVLKKVCYGLALPGLAVGGTLFMHVAAKYIFVRVLRNSRHLAKNTPTHYIAWYGSVILVCAVGFIIAEAIPFFNDLLSLIGALLATVICIQMESFMWMWDNIRSPSRGTTSWNLLMAMNVLFFILGWFLMIAGTYGSVVTINDNFKSGDVGSAFSCADNSS
ncbi:uncharacterized protein I303_100586 [Kwoniella dejecticola CBS 10117]|uniref:Amino acid transporter transmembrane domain-containing protein n=1 Tax=Kwoniella dejecticola CBS 10117 TaxID=1296121 RepID=A0A1A6AFC0_9TREE|nr:uncharacterized protein I303_00589 [Kwoniella dejecticola CBS 10117]OBR88772.1 hypothetical protein I303_00589 [Kwoniella dejecticola CBS 10117]